MPSLALRQDCTGCGACAYRCPKHCIHMEADKIGVAYPRIDDSACVDCHVCEKVCPIITPNLLMETRKCYAAWNNDEDERSTSASGGIAIAIYKEALINGMVAIGASQNADWTVTHKVVKTPQELTPLKNSKYTFSSALEVYPRIQELLKVGKNIVMVGLPCQIAAVRSLFGEHTSLFLIDIVCHGSTPTLYLQQHIQSLEKMIGEKANRMSFRSPEKGTENYFFTLYNNRDEIIYAKRSIDGDSYNIGFHRAISYRENCYHCRFACPERVSDITLGDYHGLGKEKPCSYSEKKVSTILIHTNKGQQLVDLLITKGIIFAEERPISESVNGDAQLRHPSPKTASRYDFEKYISNYQGDFERAMGRVINMNRYRENRQRIKETPQRLIRKIMNLIRLDYIK